MGRFARLRRCLWLVAATSLTVYYFLLPGLTVVRTLGDPALGAPGVPELALELHERLAPRVESWAKERILAGRGSRTELHDVPTTEWPLFTAVFYLMATEALQARWEGGGLRTEEPRQYAAGAVRAARDLLLDPAHHSWVRRHWGDGYLHRENVFFRSLLIAGLTSYDELTRDGTALPVLRDQVETLSRDLGESKHGVLDDYPRECYPIDVLAAVAFIRRADTVLGTDHRAFVARSVRAFEGPMADQLGLVPFRVELDSGRQLQPSRGIGNSWVSLFAPELWPERAKTWYARYQEAFWQDRVWAAGFREFARRGPGTDWLFEVDAGPVVDGFGTSANAFGVGAARRNGRFDHAYTLAAQMIALSWPLPNGTLLTPRLLSHAADAPYLGETAILYFLTVSPADGFPVVTGGKCTGFVWGTLCVYFGVSALALFGIGWIGRRWWTRSQAEEDAISRAVAGETGPAGRVR
jgi:hypothetical protein